MMHRGRRRWREGDLRTSLAKLQCGRRAAGQRSSLSDLELGVSQDTFLGDLLGTAVEAHGAGPTAH